MHVFFHKVLHQVLWLDHSIQYLWYYMVRLILYCNILSVIEMYTMRLIDNHYLKYLFVFYLANSLKKIIFDVTMQSA